MTNQSTCLPACHRHPRELDPADARAVAAAVLALAAGCPNNLEAIVNGSAMGHGAEPEDPDEPPRFFELFNGIAMANGQENQLGLLATCGDYTVQV